MSDFDRSMLRDVFVSSYETLKIHLTRKLGCEVLAREALHDTYLRLHRPGDITVVQPRAYLWRMALNVASDNRRNQKRAAHNAQIDAHMLEMGDDAADSARWLAARQDLETLENALAELTPRRRRILLESRLDGFTLRQIAGRLNVSQRLVELELKAAVLFCAGRVGRPVVQRFGPRPASVSAKERARVARLATHFGGVGTVAE
jgi:RNA polymerase sigma-70 factor (ECF subfamily)